MMPLMRGDPVPHRNESGRRGAGVAVEDVDGDLNGAGADLFGLGEDVGGVNTGGTCTDNGDAGGVLLQTRISSFPKFTGKRQVRREGAVSLVFTSCLFYRAGAPLYGEKGTKLSK